MLSAGKYPEANDIPNHIHKKDILIALMSVVCQGPWPKPPSGGTNATPSLKDQA